MSDPDRTRQREHWLAIAEQLGLGPEPEGSAPSDARPDQASRAEEAAPIAEPYSAPTKPTERRKEEPPRRGRRSRSPGAHERPERTDLSNQAAVDAAGEKEMETETAQSGEDSSSPRRGQRRRPRRVSAETEAKATKSGSGAAVSSEGEIGSETAERPKRRGRGRGRSKKGAAAETTDRTPVEEEAGRQVATPEETGQEELDDFRSLSNWNVPSWNELIASLYRPER